MSRRTVYTALDVSPDGSMLRLTAECDDELTEFALIGSPAVLGYKSVEDVGEALKGNLGRMLIAEHVGRCSVCGDSRG